MTWANPAALWLLALAAPLAGLFIYRRRARVVVVPSLAYWVDRSGFSTASPFGRRLRRLLTLLVQILILTLLVLGLSDPKIVDDAEDLFIILDCSATMQTHEEGGTRLELAVTRTIEIVDEQPAGTRLMLIRAGGTPEVAFRGQSSSPRLRNVLASLESDDVNTDLSGALSMVERFARPGRASRVFVVSDFCGAGIDRSRKSGLQVKCAQVGSPQLNRGIVNLGYDSDRQTLKVTVGHNRPENQPFALTVTAGGEIAARHDGFTREKLTEVVLPLPLDPGTSLRVALEPDDALPLDNVAYGVVPESDDVSVRLVSRGNVFLEQAIKASDFADLETVLPGQWRHDNPPDVTILDGPILDKPLGLAGSFIVFSPRATDAVLSDEVALSWWLPSHPVLKDAAPDRWGYISSTGSQPLADTKTIVAGSSGPLLYEWHSHNLEAQSSKGPPPSRMLVFNFELQDSALALTSAFPILVWNAINYLTGHEGTQESVASPTGTAIVVPRRTMPRSPHIRCPDRSPAEMVGAGDQYTWTDTMRQGIYDYGDGEHRRRIAMNWMSLTSTEFWSPTHTESASTAIDDGAVAGWAVHLSWRRLLVVGLAVCMVEWFLYHRQFLRMG